jgi:hypothetical protein
MDIDLLGKTENSVSNLERICHEVCQLNGSDDGMYFSADTVKGAIIQTEAEYEGVRVEFQGDLNKAIVHMQIDIGFGDVILPEPEIIPYPTLLEFPAPALQAYTRESVIAEKFETMVKRGLLNSRMKDFFDIWTLANQFSFQSDTLAASIRATFKQRGTVLDTIPECFSEAFTADPVKNSQWNAFIRKNHIRHGTLSLKEVVSTIAQFLLPILTLQEGKAVSLTWNPPNKWL